MKISQQLIIFIRFVNNDDLIGKTINSSSNLIFVPTFIVTFTYFYVILQLKKYLMFLLV